MAQDPEYTTVFYTPRFSYKVLKLTVTVHVLGMTVVRGTVCTGWVWYGDGYSGWVLGGVYR